MSEVLGEANIHAAALSDVGRVRANNEDAFVFDPAIGLYIVCDGMGGAAAGEVASAMACSIALDTFATLETAQPLEDRLNHAIHAANTAVWDAGLAPGRHGMGTTLVAAAIEANRLVIANVGDSRAYILRAGSWQQLTTDHSYINELIASGAIQVEHSQSRELQRFASVITRAIGSAEDVVPDFFALELGEGDTVLLASDGLTRYLDAGHFEELIDPANLEASCQRLIDAANQRGGIDNITCLLVRHDAPDAAHDDAPHGVSDESPEARQA